MTDNTKDLTPGPQQDRLDRKEHRRARREDRYVQRAQQAEKHRPARRQIEPCNVRQVTCDPRTGLELHRTRPCAQPRGHIGKHDFEPDATGIASIGGTIRDERTQRGWTQAVLAYRAGVSRPTIARIETGHDITATSLAKIATSLNLELQLRPCPPVTDR